MKRDIDLIKEVLIQIETSKAPAKNIDVFVKEIEPEVISYHISLLYEAGFINAEDTSGFGTYRWIPTSLTWQGHEFLDGIRNDTVWGKLKSKMKEHGGNMPFHVIKELVISYSKELI